MIVATSDGANAAALERSIGASEPVDAATAAVMLREAKQIMARHGVVFFLRQGTCLGAVREQRIIPWDDDLDIGSVLGLHGLTEEAIGPILTSFRDIGYYVQIEHEDHFIAVAMIRSSIRLDWTCFRIIDGNILHFPGIWLPVRLFTELKEIDFLGEKFHVPNPPEEYLLRKYGPEWTTPKNIGFEKDIVQLVPASLIPGNGSKLKQFLVNNVLQWRAGRLRVLDLEGKPVSGAEVMVAGVGRYRTNKKGYARFYLPGSDWYAVVISYGGNEELLYMERMAPGGKYIYRPGSSPDSLRYCVLATE
jgi:hypothetical protein